MLDFAHQDRSIRSKILPRLSNYDSNSDSNWDSDLDLDSKLDWDSDSDSDLVGLNRIWQRSGLIGTDIIMS